MSLPDGHVELPADVHALMPPRPVLRPGWHVARRDDATVQVGLDPPRRVVAPATPGVLALLRCLTSAQTPSTLTSEALTMLRSLLDADLVVDADQPRRAAAQSGRAAVRRVRDRADSPVGVVAPHHLEPLAVRSLAAAGLVRADGAGAVHLVLSEGEPVRDELDALVRDDVAHLPVVSSHGRLEVGPLVVPGATACLRCVDAHRADGDPRRSLVLEQCARAVEAGAVQPHDPVLWTWGLAWAARDLARLAEGDRPSTWSTSFVIDVGGVPREQRWERHPACGCAWQQVAVTA